MKNFIRKCITPDLSERFNDFKSIKKVIQQYFKLNRNVIEIILETLESYAQDRDRLKYDFLIPPSFLGVGKNSGNKIDPVVGS